MQREIDPRSDEAHSFATQQRAMTRKRREPVRAHDPMTRHRRVVAGAHDVADGARGTRAAGEQGDQTVRCDAAARDSPDHLENGAAPCVHALIMPSIAHLPGG